MTLEIEGFGGYKAFTDILRYALPYAKDVSVVMNSKLEEKAKSSDEFEMHRVGYDVYFSSNTKPDIKFSQRVGIDNESIDDRLPELGRDLADSLESRDPNISSIHEEDKIELKYDRDKDPEQTDYGRINFYSVKDGIGSILKVPEINILNYLTRRKGEDVIFDTLDLKTGEIVKMFTSFRGKNKRSAPLVYAAIRMFQEEQAEGLND